jgi:hypothetical protein
MLIVAADDVPAEFVASKVKVVEAKEAVGVPEMTQVVALTVRVPGKDPALALPDLIPQAETEAPLLIKVVGVIAMA